MNKELIQSVNKELALELPDKLSYEEVKEKLSVYINHLINKDFEKLVALLYRIDVNEKKLQQFLQTQIDENTAELIADLILQRQLEKIKSRQQNNSDNPISEEEKW
jgi:hypothetical protein